ncbi:MAG: YibE/F family protein [Lentisphaeria bacterium]|nr:YibE/F family protein [Lentisphaeria bacterium]
MILVSGGRKRDFCFSAVILLCCIALYLIPSPPPLAKQSGKPVAAKVIAVDNSLVEQHGLVKFGSQRLTVRLLNPKYKGAVFQANNELRAQMELDKEFTPGDTALVILQGKDRPGDAVLVAQDHYRIGWGLALFAGFCLLLCIFGGWTGAKALFSFIFSCLMIWKAVIPMVLRGWSASWIIFGSVCVLTAVIVYLVAGVTKKGFAAFAGSAAGIFAGLAMAHIFTRIMKINGAAMPYVQTLLYSGYEYLNIQDIFIGAMILASSGAVMDLAMDIAAGVEEVARHNPELPASELIKSGLRIGRSVVGTMTTTLLLAYSGGYITLLMMFASQGTDVLDFLNSTLVASETVKTLIGSFSLVLVAPFTAFFSGWLFGMKKTGTPTAEP